MSKFFTWTKGDRRNAVEALRSGKVVPIPIECISIKGLDYAQAEKLMGHKRRRPPPLLLGDSPDSSGKDASSSNDSLALQHAAVRSATSLMTVMNDVLRSPPMSAYLAAPTSPWFGLPPSLQRPRAHTAPSTPLCEAPVMDIAELPGLMAVEDKKRSQAAVKSEPKPDLPSAASAEPDESQTINEITPSPVSTAKETTPTSSTASTLASASHSCSTVTSTSSAASNNSDATFPDQKSLQPMRSELEQQLSALRTSHEAHIRSLKRAHEKEIASHAVYIALLERRQDSAPDHTAQSGNAHLRLRTSMLRGSPGLPLSSLKEQAHVEHQDGSESSPQDLFDGCGREQAGLQRILQISKRKEQAMRNTIASLEARLVESNNERIDLLEGFHAVCEKLRLSSRRERTLARELEYLHEQMILPHPKIGDDDVVEQCGSGNTTQARNDIVCSDTSPSRDSHHPLLLQIRGLKRALAEKDVRIGHLEQLARSSVQPQAITHTAPANEQSPLAPNLTLPEIHDCSTESGLVASVVRMHAGLGIATVEFEKTPRTRSASSVPTVRHNTFSPPTTNPGPRLTSKNLEKAPPQFDKALPTLPRLPSPSSRSCHRGSAKVQWLEGRRAFSDPAVPTSARGAESDKAALTHASVSESLCLSSGPVTPLAKIGSRRISGAAG
ncbi:hypothetical protein BDY17DRAFT_325493 [Neohortaea acidophila]|uniref:Uncharacterized protein n=1 Tax=Neohortaea acidophila TaxID=245834 RepID=A0A6A6PRB6_9PEZI|nr:uncharacterized protein BDY17DRAFT_325493 [Neohortaea acidophila]KAF2481993.1 hypothetical protein BDY17DRAFT_325493 [Neohortaea acidophila]